MAHDEFKEMLALHALGALDSVESANLERHLESCDECARALVDLQNTAATLAYALERIEPGTDLRARILRDLPTRRTPEMKPLVANVVELRSGREPSSQWLKFGSIAATIGLVAMIGFAVIQVSRVAKLVQELANLTIRVSETTRQLELERQFREVLVSPTGHLASLGGMESTRAASAKLAYDGQTGRAVLVTNNLAAAPSGSAYQLWFIANGSPIPGGVFKTDAKGAAMVVDQIPMEGRKASVFAVTLEPEQGVKKPTGSMVLKGGASDSSSPSR